MAWSTVIAGGVNLGLGLLQYQQQKRELEAQKKIADARLYREKQNRKENLQQLENYKQRDGAASQRAYSYGKILRTSPWNY